MREPCECVCACVRVVLCTRGLPAECCSRMRVCVRAFVVPIFCETSQQPPPQTRTQGAFVCCDDDDSMILCTRNHALCVCVCAWICVDVFVRVWMDEEANVCYVCGPPAWQSFARACLRSTT